MKKIPVIFFLAMSWISSFGQTKFVNEFLNIGVGARAHGMFGSMTAITEDVASAYWNPAGLARISSPFQVAGMHASWFGGIANYDYIGIGKTFSDENNGFGSITLIRMGIDNIPNTLNLIGPDGTVNYDNVLEFSAADYAFMFSYGQNLALSGLSVGGSAKIIYRNIGSFGSAVGFGFDLGIQYTKGHFKFGLMGRDITTTVNNWSFSLTPEEEVIFQQTGNEIPVSGTEVALPKLIFSGAYTLEKGNFTYVIASDIRFSTDGTLSGVFSGNNIGVDPSFGFEAGYNKQVFLRAGIGNIQRTLNETNPDTRSFSFQPNIGLGIDLGRINIDYALTNIGSVSGVLVSHIFSLSLDLEGR